MSEVRVVPVAGRRARRDFLSFPYRLYRGHPYWVPPLRIDQKALLDPAKHPFHLHATVQCFLALRGGETAGRIAAILDPRFSEFHQEEAGFFGFLDMVEDASVVRALIGTAVAWLREHGAEVIRGPVNPSTNYECGVLVDGFDSSPRVMMAYNFPYYGPLLEQVGLRKAKDLFAYEIPTAEARAGRAEALYQRALATGVRIRPIRLSAFQRDVESAWDVYNSAWARNWGFVPMTRAEFLWHGKELRPIIVPEMALFAELDGSLAGVALAVPDINEALKHAGGRLLPFGLFRILWHKRNIRTCRVVLLGVRPEHRATPIAAGLYALLIREAKRLGYQCAECSWILEDNVLMRRAIEGLGGTITKTYRIYELGPVSPRVPS